METLRRKCQKYSAKKWAIVICEVEKSAIQAVEEVYFFECKRF